MIKVLKAKIHRATVSKADLDYEGSITIPKELLLASSIKEYEAVDIWNVTNGNRLQTYAIEGDKSGEVTINGAAAHLMNPGDIIIIAAFNYIKESDTTNYEPKVVFVDSNNLTKKEIK